jgi:arginyl-tRNA synthetase
MLVNILGEDHKLESKQVEIALRELNAKILPFPIFYSFVSMPGGKMSTRRGRVVYLDDLIDEITSRAYKEVKKRRSEDLSDKQMKKIADKIGIGALRYNIIKVQPEKDIVFKWEEALNFEGNASPFIQYSHARCCGIISKNKDDFINTDFSSLNHDSEIKLIKKIAEFPLTIKEASEKYKPHLLTSYLFDLASVFNQFYRDCPVIIEEKAEIRCARLKIVDTTRIIFKNGLGLLGIESPEEM